MSTKLDPLKIGVRCRCSVCGNTKKPVGRSAPMDSYYCDNDCEGYLGLPYPGSLWPGESEADFGYHVSTTSTNQDPTLKD